MVLRRLLFNNNASMPGQLVINYTIPTGKVPPSAKITSDTHFFKSTVACVISCAKPTLPLMHNGEYSPVLCACVGRYCGPLRA